MCSVTKELVDILAYRWGIRTSEEELDELLGKVLRRRRSKKMVRKEDIEELDLDDLVKQSKLRKKFKGESSFVSEIARAEAEKIDEDVRIVNEICEYLED